MSFEKLSEKYGSAPDFYGRKICNIHERAICGDQMIHMACVVGDIEDVRELVGLGADIMSIGEGGYTPLHYAVEQGNMDVVHYLIEVGADVLYKNFDGESPRDIAELQGLNL